MNSRSIRALFSIGVLIVSLNNVNGEVITYEFEGFFQDTSGFPIAPGSTISGTFSYDTETLGVLIQNRGVYVQSMPHWSLVVSDSSAGFWEAIGETAEVTVFNNDKLFSNTPKDDRACFITGLGAFSLAC